MKVIEYYCLAHNLNLIFLIIRFFQIARSYIELTISVIMKRLKEQKHMLYLLKSSNSKLRKSTLKEAQPEVIKTLCVICMNTLNGNIKIPTKCLMQLRKYKRTLRQLSLTNANIPSKRRLLVQK